MKITGIDLFYYLPSIFYNYNDDFCLIHPLCRGKSNGKSVALRPFYQQFLPQDHGAERPLYKSEILLRVKKVGINWPQLRSIGAGLGEGLMVWLWKYLFQSPLGSKYFLTLPFNKDLWRKRHFKYAVLRICCKVFGFRKTKKNIT